MLMWRRRAADLGLRVWEVAFCGESHRVTGSQGRRATFMESQGVAESIAAHIAAHIAQASRLGGGGVALTGRHA
eukprot:scaffold14659_cov51-Phaeocystis_antarctica.AAC.3